MEKRTPAASDRSGRTEQQQQHAKRARKKSEYGRQLDEKQKVKELYGMRERQFKRFFDLALHSKGATGEELLSLLERRLDNVVYRMKFSTTRRQARQIIVHGHIVVNGHKVYSPSFLVSVGDVVTLAANVPAKAIFVEQVVDKRAAATVKVPDWVEVDRKTHTGRILRLPVRVDVQIPVEEYLIVELYSKQ